MKEIVITSTGFILSIASILFVYMKYKYTYKWNRSKATNDLLIDVYLGDFNDLRYNFENMIGMESWTNGTYEDCEIVVKNKETLQDLHVHIDTFLRFYSFIGAQCRHKIIDREMIFLNFGYTIPRFFDWVKEYLKNKRDKTGEKHLHLEFDELAYWIKEKLYTNSKKYKDLEEKHRRDFQKTRHKYTRATSP